MHRDVRPSNILVRKDGTTKLLAFGIAAVRGSELTMGHQLVGSPSYMAPERIRGRPSGPAADQFSLGVVVYEMLTGVNPFDDETHEARMVRVLECRPAPLAAACPSVPAPLVDLVARMMGRRPEDRLPSMDEVADRLADIGATLGQQLTRYSAPEG